MKKNHKKRFNLNSKNIIIDIILLLVAFSQFGDVLAQDTVKGGYKKCVVSTYKYKYDVRDTSSKEIVNTYKYNEAGMKIEEETYWFNKLSYFNKFAYNSQNKIIEDIRISDFPPSQYRLKYIYDGNGNNTSINCYSGGDTLLSCQIIEFNKLGKVFQHSYYDKWSDTANCIEFYFYNINGTLFKKIFSSYNYYQRDICEIYFFDSNNVLCEINRIQIPEPIGNEDEMSWKHDATGYTLRIQHPSDYFDTRIIFKYDNQANLKEKTIYSCKNCIENISIEKYFYDSNFNLIKKVLYGDIHGQPYPYLEFIYDYSR